jgi:hypothetical protein
MSSLGAVLAGAQTENADCLPGEMLLGKADGSKVVILPRLAGSPGFRHPLCGLLCDHGLLTEY